MGRRNSPALSYDFRGAECFAARPDPAANRPQEISIPSPAFPRTYRTQSETTRAAIRPPPRAGRRGESRGRRGPASRTRTGRSSRAASGASGPTCRRRGNRGSIWRRSSIACGSIVGWLQSTAEEHERPEDAGRNACDVTPKDCRKVSSQPNALKADPETTPASHDDDERPGPARTTALVKPGDPLLRLARPDRSGPRSAGHRAGPWLPR